MKPNHVDDKVHELTESFTCFSEHMALKTFGLSTALLSTNSGRPKKNQLWYNYRRLKNPFQKVTSEKINKRITLNSITGLNNQWFQFSSVTQSCPTLCDPMDCSTLGLPVHHQHPESTQTHVHWVGDAIQPSHPVSSYRQSFPASGSFQKSQLFTSGGQSIGVSVSTSVLPMNIQDWSPKGWTGWISLQSKGLSRVFSNTTVQKHQFFSAQLSL